MSIPMEEIERIKTMRSISEFLEYPGHEGSGHRRVAAEGLPAPPAPARLHPQEQ